MWEVYISLDVQSFLKKQDKFIEERIRKSLTKITM